MSTRAKLGLLLSLCFSQGLPYGFFTQALPALLRQLGRSLPEIGLASLLALPWALKFLWAPLVDRLHLPGVGRRRSWILPLQALAALAMAGLALVDPQADLTPVLVGFFGANLLAATQDIATDGLAVSLLSPAERGLGNGVQVAGYRVGMIVGGGALLVLFDVLGWAGVFLCMAGLLALAAIPIARHAEAPAPPLPPGPPVLAELGAFLRRPGMPAWLGVLLVFKGGEALAGGMLRPMLIDLGLDLSDIGWMLGTAGFTAGLVGALLGGWAAGRLGRLPALVLAGLLQAATVASFSLPALGLATGFPALTGVVVLEHLAGGVATAALFTAMMDACDDAAGGTDYTVQASVVVVSTGAGAALSGFSAKALGYPLHFGLAAVLALVGTLPFLWALARGPGRPPGFVRLWGEAAGAPPGP